MLLLSSRQGLGIVLSGWCWGINQPQALLNKQLQGYSSSHSFISCSGGTCLQWSQESCSFLQWRMSFTAWCSCHGISSAVLTATSLQSPILQPHSSSSGVSMLWALQGQYPLSCWQPSHRAMGCRVPRRLCSIVAKLELCCCWGDAATTKGAANFSHLFFHQQGIKQ